VVVAVGLSADNFDRALDRHRRLGARDGRRPFHRVEWGSVDGRGCGAAGSLAFRTGVWNAPWPNRRRRGGLADGSCHASNRLWPRRLVAAPHRRLGRERPLLLSLPDLLAHLG